MLASDLGQQMMQTFQDIKQFNDTNPDGPFGAITLTDAPKDLPDDKVRGIQHRIQSAYNNRRSNGTLQNQVTNTTTSLQGQVNQLQARSATRPMPTWPPPIPTCNRPRCRSRPRPRCCPTSTSIRC